MCRIGVYLATVRLPVAFVIKGSKVRLRLLHRDSIKLRKYKVVAALSPGQSSITGFG